MKLNSAQRRVTAEILGNISVAWFTFGVISPFFSKPKPLDFLFSFVLGLVMAVSFAFFALFLIKKLKR